MELTTHFQPALKLKMCGPEHRLFHMSSKCVTKAQGQVHVYLLIALCIVHFTLYNDTLLT